MTDPLTATHQGHHWAWVGCRVDAAADLTEVHEFTRLSEVERQIKVHASESAWLSSHLDPAWSARLDLRYLSDPGQHRLGCVLLGRVQGDNVEAVEAAATHLRHRLSGLPPHTLAGGPLTAEEVRHHLAPFRPAPTGLVEIRKRIHAATPQRPDAGVEYYLAVEPLPITSAPWEGLWRALAEHPSPVLVSIGLTPVQLGSQFSDHCGELASQYQRLATPSRTPEGIFTSGVNLAPDAFAVDAARLYADAARRYAGVVFRLRLSLASPDPLPTSLVELIGATIAPAERHQQQHSLTATLSGPAHTGVRPVPTEFDRAWRNVSTIDNLEWGPPEREGLPPVPSLIRQLAVLVDIREVGSAARLPSAVNGHMPGFPVRRPGSALEVDYTTGTDDLVLGRQMVGGRLAGPLGVPLRELTRHGLFVGMPGSGKTNSLLTFCEQLWRDHHIPFLVIEPVNSALDDYRWLATRPGMEDLVVLTVGDESVAPFRLNPFAVPAGVRIGAHISTLLACFDAAFGLWDPLPHIYNRALRSTYANAGIIASDTSGPEHVRWPTLQDFVRALREVTKNLEYAGEVRSNIIASSVLRAESLAEGACATTLDCASSYPIEELLQRPVVIELAGVGDNEKEQSLVTALILQSMTEHYKATRTSGDLAHITIVEEAHRLLGRPHGIAAENREGNAQMRAAQAFANSLAENRKYGEGLMIIEQIPSKLVEDAYKNTNLKVMHRLPDESDRQLIGSAMRFSPDQERHAATLAPFTGYVYHDRLDRPALIQVPNVRGEQAATENVARARLANDNDLRARFVAFAAQEPAIRAAIAPFNECGDCRHQCQFRSRASSVVNDDGVSAVQKMFEKRDDTSWDDTWSRALNWAHNTAGKAPLPLRTVSTNTQRDYEACVFVHAVRRAWRNGGDRIVRDFRRRQAAMKGRQSERPS